MSLCSRAFYCDAVATHGTTYDAWDKIFDYDIVYFIAFFCVLK